MDDEAAERPQVRVTFERAVPMFRNRLTSELESEGLAAFSGPPPGEYRGGREAIDVVRVTLQILGGVKVLEDTAESVARIVRAISAAIGRSPTRPEMVITIYGPDDKPLKEVRVSEKRKGR